LVEQIVKISLAQNKEEVEGLILIVKEEFVINRVPNSVKDKEIDKENVNVKGKNKDKEKEIRTMIKNQLFLENHQRVQIE
jgi:hypothetical protein